MRSADYKYLETAYASFLDSAIQRTAQSGDLSYNFRLSADELKEATGRERLRPETVADVERYFADLGARATFQSAGNSFRIYIDLNQAALSPRQAQSLSDAMQTAGSNGLL